MSFTGRVVMVAMDRKYRDGDVDVFVLIVDMIESAAAVSGLQQASLMFQ
jgi:hypothetical protein